MAHYTPPTLHEALVDRLKRLKSAAENWGGDEGSDRWLDIQAYELAIATFPDKADPQP